MARNYARISTDIWTGDNDWRKLSIRDQWLYKLLTTQKKLSLAGSLDIRLKAWSRYSSDVNEDGLLESLESLVEHRFIDVDWDTDELAIRTFVEHDDVLKNRNLGKGMWAAWEAIESEKLQRFLVENFPDEAWEERFGPKCDPP